MIKVTSVDVSNLVHKKLQVFMEENGCKTLSEAVNILLERSEKIVLLKEILENI